MKFLLRRLQTLAPIAVLTLTAQAHALERLPGDESPQVALLLQQAGTTLRLDHFATKARSAIGVSISGIAAPFFIALLITPALLEQWLPKADLEGMRELCKPRARSAPVAAAKAADEDDPDRTVIAVDTPLPPPGLATRIGSAFRALF